MSSTIIKEYYTTGELAEICHVSPTTISRAINNKQLKATTTPGGHFRVSRKEAEEFLEKNNIPIPRLHLRTKRILIVEDNVTELRLFSRALEKGKKYELKTTGSGYEAGYLTESFKPDLILLDIFLDDIDGRQVARLIRSDPDLKHTKIVAVTGAKNPKDIKEIITSHFDSFIFKPIDPDELRMKIEKLLN